MSVQAITWALEQTVGSPAGKVILMCLANYADKNGACFPGNETIAKECEVSKRSVVDWMQRLEEAALIKRYRRTRPDGSRASDSVVLCLPWLEHPTSCDQGAETAPSQPKVNEMHQGDEAKVQMVQSQGEAASPPVQDTTYPSLEPSVEPISSLRSEMSPEREFEEQFWPAYPRKVGKRHALKAYLSARKRTSFEEIMDGARRYADLRRGQEKQFTKHPATWLNGDCWSDEPELPQATSSRLGSEYRRDDPIAAVQRIFAERDIPT